MSNINNNIDNINGQLKVFWSKKKRDEQKKKGIYIKLSSKNWVFKLSSTPTFLVWHTSTIHLSLFGPLTLFPRLATRILFFYTTSYVFSGHSDTVKCYWGLSVLASRVKQMVSHPPPPPTTTSECSRQNEV